MTTHVAFQTGVQSPLLERFDFFVPVFFALSAFLLARGTWRREGYYRRRVARIAPAYVVCVAVVLLVLPPLATVTVPQVLANLLLLQVYVPNGLIAGLTHLWSLCAEAALYAALPGYMALSPRGRWVALLAAVPLGLLWPWAVAGADHEVVNLQIWPPSYAPWFAVGLLCAELERAGVRWRGPRWPYPLLALGVAWFAGVVGPAGLTHPTPAEFNVRVICGTAFAALWVAPFALGPGDSVLSSRPLRLLGRWSYSFFLWHMAVLYFVFPLLGATLFDAPFLPVWLTTFVISTAVAYVSFELVEVPGKARLATARQPARASNQESPA